MFIGISYIIHVYGSVYGPEICTEFCLRISTEYLGITQITMAFAGPYALVQNPMEIYLDMMPKNFSAQKSSCT